MLRSWPASDGGPESILQEDAGGWTSAPNTNGPYELVYELRTSATLEELKVGLGEIDESSAKTLHLAVSSVSATSGFSDVGTYQLTQADEDYPLSASTRARWVKVTIDQRGPSTHLDELHLFGRLDDRPASAGVTGLWRYYEDDPYPQFNESKDAAGSLPAPQTLAAFGPVCNDMNGCELMEIRQSGPDLVGSLCTTGFSEAFRGRASGGTVNLSAASGPFSPALVNAEGTMLVAFGQPRNFFAMRMSGGGSCAAVTGAEPHGTGTPVMLIFDQNPDRFGPYEQPKHFPGFRFVPTVVSAFDQTTLGGYQIAVISQVCNAATALNKTQAQALVDWVYSGGKLIIQDSDDCTNTDYSFLPYKFETSKPGKNAARGSKLVNVESNALGSTNKTSAAFVDVQAYVADSLQQLGDANLVVTQDRHWCGHFYGTNILNENGFEQAYAPFGQGLFIYDGFDADDNGLEVHDKITLLELKEAPDATLPCTQLVAEPFTFVEPGIVTFDLGSAKEITIPIDMFGSHGYSGGVSLTTVPPSNAPFSVSLSNPNVALKGGAGSVNLKVGVPANAKPGSYNVVVKGTDAEGNTASTTVTIASVGAPPAATAPAARPPSGPATPKIAPALAKDKRVAVYGIYFDFAKATLKPESTPVLDEIAGALQTNPDWNLIIEGHTDNVGGAAYNLDLSNRRAQAVRDALVTRYHIDGGRLSTVGYGFTRPKASNDTPDGRALNRRVELVRK